MAVQAELFELVTNGTVSVDGDEPHATPMTFATVGLGNVPDKSPPAVVDIEQPVEPFDRSLHADCAVERSCRMTVYVPAPEPPAVTTPMSCAPIGGAVPASRQSPATLLDMPTKCPAVAVPSKTQDTTPCDTTCTVPV